MEIVLKESLRRLIKRVFSLAKVLGKGVISRTFEFVWRAKGVHCQIIRRWVKKRAIYYTHWIWQIVPFLLLSSRWIGILNFPQLFRNHRRTKSPQGIAKPKCNIIIKVWEKQPTHACHYQTQWKSNTTQLDHKGIKFIHLLRCDLGPLEVGVRRLCGVFVALMGKEPPVPKQGRHDEGQDKKKEVARSSKNDKAKQYGANNALIAIKLHLNLRHFCQGRFGGCVYSICHVVHPFLSNFTKKCFKLKEFINSIPQQNQPCVTFLPTEKSSP